MYALSCFLVHYCVAKVVIQLYNVLLESADVLKSTDLHYNCRRILHQ